MNRFIVLLALFVAAVAAEAPYAASGWRPEGAPFRLPTEYAAPLVVFQPQPRVVELQFTRENLQFAGRQIAVEQQQQHPAVATTPAPSTTTSLSTRQSNDNVPVATTVQPDLDPVNVQALPAEQSKDFSQQVKQNARLRQQAKLQAPRPFFPISGQLRALPGVPSPFFQQQVAALPQIPQQQQQQPQQVPAETYGPPEQEEEQPQQQPEQEETPGTTVQPLDNDDDAAAEDEYEDDAGRTVVAISNGFSGQYYILSPDNTLQRVVYSATQTDEDRLVNGFSAQLKYAPVEPIRGPVYTYNEQGQLVRIYKK
ncbi:gamma-gliadin-like [Anopheles albimanus]|uniref:gamma-gliadin-like n=1 Tax=Anopheles albimanus TaxID=7167 RepID=UPI00163F3AFC|nr:gamma-gliadin-like [Anopheles albimanus]